MTSINEFIESIQFVIVCYGADFRESSAYAGLEEIGAQVTGLVHLAVYDNSPAHNSPVPVPGRVRLHYAPQKENRGLSPCYNEAAQHAGKGGRKWLLFLDQDTRLSPELLLSYHEASRCHPKIKLFCPMLRTRSGKIVSPFAWYFSRGTFLRRIEPGITSCSHRAACNSGMMIDTETFKAVGGYNPKIPLDFSDVSFFRRYEKRHACFFVSGETLEHSLSPIEETDPAKALFRFEKYCQSALAYGVEVSAAGRMRCYGFLRAMKLALKWHDRRFLETYRTSFLGK